ncbi:MAG: sucrase ferredoxin [Kineosporiaceae bacterium]
MNGPAPAFRCSDAARARGDDPAGTAVPAVRLLLVELPGPWPRDPRTRLDPAVVGPLEATANAAGTRLLLVRRPGRHPADRVRPHRWALADTRPGIEAVHWGVWRTDRDLAAVDPRAAVLPREARATGPQEVALVCTHGSRDVCCAVRGRPVAAALAGLADLDVWESTHLGGCRFAGNAVLLPTGDTFGGLDPASAAAVVVRWRAGRLDARHYRGRLGRPPVAQVVSALAARALGDDRRDAVSVRSVSPAGADGLRRAVVEHDGRHHRAVFRLDPRPAARLTCSAALADHPRRPVLVTLEPPREDAAAP